MQTQVDEERFFSTFRRSSGLISPTRWLCTTSPTLYVHCHFAYLILMWSWEVKYLKSKSFLWMGRGWGEGGERGWEEKGLYSTETTTHCQGSILAIMLISLSLKTIKVITGPHNTIEVNENLLYIRSNPSNLTLPNKEQIQTFKANNTFLIHKTNIQETMDHVYPSYL